jgi:16S rRNA (uracil1498-N3)-methyltransferase
MPVFFISSHSITNTCLTIEGPLFDHLTKSLRFREGDQLIVCDETRQRHHVHIEKLKKSALEGEIRKTEHGPPPSEAKIILGQAMLKGDHMNWAIQKATELGIDTIVPLLTERVIIRPKADRFHSLHERYSRIALDAAQQSERWEVPDVFPPTSLHEFLEQFRHATVTCLLIEREHLPGLNSLPLEKGFIGKVVLAVGPEGGWTSEEQQDAQRHDFTQISLGPSILRGETAPLAALSIVQFRLGHLENVNWINKTEESQTN